MIAGSALRDTQNEVLSIEGADITELARGNGRFNDNHGSGAFNSIGRVTSAKKIFKEEDCDNDRHRYYWNKIKAPYIYVRGFLYDDEDHPNARAAAAILRHIHKADAPLKLKASVEGGVLSRGVSDPSLLARTKIHSVAITFTPANNSTLVEPVSLDKAEYDYAADEQLIKSVMHLAQTNVPSFRHIERDASANKIEENIEKINELIEHLKINYKISALTKSRILTSSLETKIDQNIAKIDEIVSSLNGDDMNKSLKNIAASAALLGAATNIASPTDTQSGDLVAKPAVSQVSAKEVKQPHPTHQKNKEIIDRLKTKNPLLAAIADYESSGGKFLDHQTISDSTSMHYGHSAGSMFGLMPHSVAEALKHSTVLNQRYPELSKLVSDVPKNHKKITETLNSSPDLATDIAARLLYLKGKKFEHDVPSTAHAWNRGVQGTLDRISNKGREAILNDDYVSNVMGRMVSHKSKPSISTISRDVASPQQKKPNLNKALTAGYGGAGSPTNMTGGSVLQSESMDMAPVDLRSVVCDRCGKEQIYAKYQTKCRSCNSPFSLEKVYKVIRK